MKLVRYISRIYINDLLFPFIAVVVEKPIQQTGSVFFDSPDTRVRVTDVPGCNVNVKPVICTVPLEGTVEECSQKDINIEAPIPGPTIAKTLLSKIVVF